MSAPTILSTVNDRLFRAAALRAARARAARTEAQSAALRQALLLVEVARRVADPVQELPDGSRPAVLLGLHRDAIRWALLAGRPGDGATSTDLRTLWDARAPEVLAAAAGDAATLGSMEGLVLGDATPSLAVTEDESRRARVFAEALVDALDAPRLRAERILTQRWTAIIMTALLVVLVACGVAFELRPKDLAAGLPFRTSSTWAGCPADANCAVLAFCTDPQLNPWAKLDLGAAKTFSRLDVVNRADCCAERALPLVVEVSADDVAWREVARRTEAFSTWTATLPTTTARFVRFSVPRQTVFHLKQVSIH